MNRFTQFPGTIAKVAVPAGRGMKATAYKLKLNDEQREWFIHWFPLKENAKVAAAMHVGQSTVSRMARDLHLTKSPEGMKAIRHRQAKHIKRVCERNGYYDSLRGHKPSQACLDATARMWQEIREGKRLSPSAAMTPAARRRRNEKVRHTRRELVRKERRRILYGQQRQTNLVLTMCRYTTSQVNHRYNAQRRGYVLAEQSQEGSPYRYTIFYDQNTHRSEIFERHLIKDGFRIEEWTFD